MQHAKAYVANPTAELVAVCDSEEKRRTAAAALSTNTTLYDDYERMLSEVRPDVVSICTPDDLHVRQALQALEAGCHVLVEKPLALTIEESEALIRKAEQSDKLVYVGQEVRLFPQIAEAKRMADEGEFGDIYFAESTYIHNLVKVVEQVPWRRNRDRFDSYMLGGGCHPVDLLRHFLGNPVSVYAVANHFNDKLPAEDCILATYTFQSGAIAKVLVAVGGVVPYSIDLKLFGTSGTIFLNNVDDTARLHKPVLGESEQWSTIPMKSGHETHVIAAQVDHVLDCIVNGTKPLVDVYEGANSVSACIAAIASYRSGQPIPIRLFAPSDAEKTQTR
jgi:predicted dehydrogenase